ncbi:MAG: alpha/beta hydrolase [Candidatus Saccharimonas sp.]
MTRFVIIHGNGGGTADDHWQPWLKHELERLGHEVIVPTMPDNTEAKAAVWLPYMKRELAIDEQTIVIGHSSGAVAAMRYAEQNKIKGSILIGACYTDLGEESEKVSGYYDDEWNWRAIKNNQDFVVVIASSDDPWIAIDEPRHIYQSIGAEYHEYVDKGHFTEEHIGGKEFPELFNIIMSRVDYMHE